MHPVLFLILLILAISVLVTYYFYLIKDSHTSYINHPFWFNTPENIVKILIFFQIFAAIGFLTTISSWLINPPKKGIMKDNMLFYTLCLFFISAIAWPIATHHKSHFLTVFSLILTAIASILLLAGTIEEDKNDIKWYKVLGMLCLCITTVLGDGVIWNANYILAIKEQS